MREKNVDFFLTASLKKYKMTCSCSEVIFNIIKSNSPLQVIALGSPEGGLQTGERGLKEKECEVERTTKIVLSVEAPRKVYLQ